MHSEPISGESAAVQPEVLSENQKTALKREAMASLRETENLCIDSIENEQAGIEFLREIRQRKKQFAEIVEPMRKATRAAYDSVLDFKKAITLPLEQAERKLSTALSQFRKTENERRKQQEAALITELEQAETDRREDLARHHEEQGDHTAAQALRETPVRVNPETYETLPGTSAGVAARESYREQWSCEVTDMQELCKAVAEGVVSQELVKPNMTELNALARGMKKHLNVPGLRAVMKLVPVTRR